VFSASSLDTTLVILGAANYDSPVQRELDLLARRDDRVRVMGHVGDRSAFLDLLHGASAYIHGHSVGGMNPSLVEAMRAEALIVALDTVFNREVLGEEGIYFPGGIGRVGDLTAVLEKVLAMEARACDRRRRAARARAEAEFATADVVDAYAALLGATSSSGRRSVRIPTRWSP
jgi:glycosyltransferase involved in cell wall biosynthesis